MRRWLATVILSTLLVACGGGSGEGLDANGRPLGDDSTATPTVPSADFQFVQDTVFTPVCTVCDAGGAAPLGLKLDEANAYAMLVGISSEQVPELLRVNPGDPDNSYLVQKIEGTAAVGDQMPQGEMVSEYICDSQYGGIWPQSAGDGLVPTRSGS